MPTAILAQKVSLWIGFRLLVHFGCSTFILSLHVFCSVILLKLLCCRRFHYIVLYTVPVLERIGYSLLVP